MHLSLPLLKPTRYSLERGESYRRSFDVVGRGTDGHGVVDKMWQKAQGRQMLRRDIERVRSLLAPCIVHANTTGSGGTYVEIATTWSHQHLERKMGTRAPHKTPRARMGHQFDMDTLTKIQY